MEKIRTHKDLIVWQKGVAFVTDVYQFTKGLPDEEKFGLVSQLRRAAVSIPTNISEGAARHSSKEFIQFLYIALASAAEIETLLIIVKNLEIATSELTKPLQDNCEELKKMLSSLIKTLKNNNIT